MTLPPFFRGLLRFQFRDDSVEGGFWFAIAVEEERVVYAFPGEVVEPALAVVEVPEGDAGDDVGVFAEETKDLRVLVGLAL